MSAWRNYRDDQWLRLAGAFDGQHRSGSRAIRTPLSVAAAYLCCIALLSVGASSMRTKDMNRLTMISTLCAAMTAPAHAQSIDFIRTTDTVRLSQNVPPTSAITIEARVWIDAVSPSFGFEHSLWREQKNAQEDKTVFICSRGVRLYLSPVVDIIWEGAVPLGRWVHIACQQANGTARIWVDGVLKQSANSSSNMIPGVSNSSNAIGASLHNDSFVLPGSICKIDWLRVSICERYTSPNFTPPSECDLLPADGCTALLFTFDEAVGSATLVNRGFLPGTATVGANWFPGATSPILAGASGDANGNGIPDACEAPPCPADIDDSGFVNGVDLAIVLTNWGPPNPKYPQADTNSDGIVDGVDLATVLGGWGACP